MPRKRSTPSAGPDLPPPKAIEPYEHMGKSRLNNPPAGLVTTETDREQPRAAALAEWITAVNADGRFCHWASVISRHPKDVAGLLALK